MYAYGHTNPRVHSLVESRFAREDAAKAQRFTLHKFPTCDITLTLSPADLHRVSF